MKTVLAQEWRSFAMRAGRESALEDVALALLAVNEAQCADYVTPTPQA